MLRQSNALSGLWVFPTAVSKQVSGVNNVEVYRATSKHHGLKLFFRQHQRWNLHVRGVSVLSWPAVFFAFHGYRFNRNVDGPLDENSSQANMLNTETVQRTCRRTEDNCQGLKPTTIQLPNNYPSTP